MTSKVTGRKINELNLLYTTVKQKVLKLLNKKFTEGWLITLIF